METDILDYPEENHDFEIFLPRCTKCLVKMENGPMKEYWEGWLYFETPLKSKNCLVSVISPTGHKFILSVDMNNLFIKIT